MLIVPRSYYKPFEYPWAYEAWLTQQNMHWLPQNISMGEDTVDWSTNLTVKEKNLLTQIFRFFTQADLDVLDCYTSKYSSLFGKPEIKMMLAAFANAETIHVDAYSYLIETLSLPEAEYAAFLDYEEMNKKHNFLKKFNTDSPEGIALTLAVYGAFTEGLQLFASFAILSNFQRFGKMIGMAQIISYSIKDESLHAASIIKLYNTFVDETRIRTKALEQNIFDACEEIVVNEDRFIDLVFEMGDLEGLTKQEMKDFVRYTANKRLQELQLTPIYSIRKNPLPWFTKLINSIEHANFFEGRATEYAKGSTTGKWEEAEF